MSHRARSLSLSRPPYDDVYEFNCHYHIIVLPVMAAEVLNDSLCLMGKTTSLCGHTNIWCGHVDVVFIVFFLCALLLLCGLFFLVMTIHQNRC